MLSMLRTDLLGCQVLNLISWKHDKIKPNLKKQTRKEM
jgi:hypothetical protein